MVILFVDLQEFELAYVPPFGSAKDPVNMAGFAAGNIIKGVVEPIHWYEIDELGENTIILDIREEVEVMLGTIGGSVNIPLNSLRNRLDELDQSKNIIVYCAMGLRGYIASRILKQNGFANVKNLSGGYNLYKSVMDDKNEAIIDEREDKLSAVGSPEETEELNEKIDIDDKEITEIDASGLQCPGPIMQVYNTMKELNKGEVLRVKATDPGFEKDIEAWCDTTNNTLLEIENKDKEIITTIQKGNSGGKNIRTKNDAKDPVTKDGKTMVVFSGELDRAIASFIIANGAAAMGSNVTLFFTFWGLNILRKDEESQVDKSTMDKMFGTMMPNGSKKLPLSNMNMLGFGPKMIRKVIQDKNVDLLETMIAQARKNGVRLVVCQMSMDLMGIKREELIDGVEIGGVATFLNAADNSNINLFI